MGGDRFIHEVVNGLYHRSDWFQFMSTVNLGFIPAGNHNTLARAIMNYSGEVFSVENAAYIAAKGRAMRMDLIEIEVENQKDKIYACNSIVWATDNSSGYGWTRVIWRRVNEGSIFYTGVKVEKRKDVAGLKEDYFSDELPEIHEEAVRHVDDPS